MRVALLAAALTSLAAAASAAPARADTLLIDRAAARRSAALPARGMSMAQVEARFGAPTERQAPAGGQKRQSPTINRWTYPTFTVYFERSRVIDAVLKQATPSEAGPRPAAR